MKPPAPMIEATTITAMTNLTTSQGTRGPAVAGRRSNPGRGPRKTAVRARSTRPAMVWPALLRTYLAVAFPMALSPTLFTVSRADRPAIGSLDPFEQGLQTIAARILGSARISQRTRNLKSLETVATDHPREARIWSRLSPVKRLPFGPKD